MNYVSEPYFLNKVNVDLGIYMKIPVILFQTQSTDKYLGSYHHITYGQKMFLEENLVKTKSWGCVLISTDMSSILFPG